MVVYKVTNKKDGKVYIGQTTQSLAERWWQHCNRCPSQKHRSYIYNAIQKDGADSFTIEVLASAQTLDALNALEEYCIKQHNSLAPNGYNLHPGGKGKMCHPETKIKISNALKGRPIKNRQNGAQKGRPVSQERRAKISKTMTGVPQPWKYKRVIAVESGMEYESVNAAAKAFNLNRVTISQLIKSGKKGRCGFSFKFA